jgi:hypothetical protein
MGGPPATWSSAVTSTGDYQLRNGESPLAPWVSGPSSGWSESPDSGAEPVVVWRVQCRGRACGPVMPGTKGVPAVVQAANFED